MDLCDFVDVRGNSYGWLVVSTSTLEFTVFAPYSLWQKGRVEQPSRKLRTKRFFNTKWPVSAVSHEVVHVGNQRAGGRDPPATRVFGQQTEVQDRRKRAAKKFSSFGH